MLSNIFFKIDRCQTYTPLLISRFLFNYLFFIFYGPADVCCNNGSSIGIVCMFNMCLETLGVIFIRQMSTKQVLQVDYKEQQGLILGWNYRDLTCHSTYFRHILVIYSNNRDEANKFLKKYLKRIRGGDLYSIIYYTDQYRMKVIRWKQKMLYDDHSFKRVINTQILYGNKQNMMEKLQNQYGQFSEPIVACVYIDNPQQAKWFKSRIIKQRFNQKYNFLVSLFGPSLQTKLSFSHEVTTISFNNQSIDEQVDFFLNHLYQAAILWANVSIQCLNGSITSTIQENWRTTNFNTIQKVFRGPTIKYDKDFLIFFGYKIKESSYDFVLRLTFVTLQGRKFVSQKKFTVTSTGQFHQKTFSMRDWVRPYHARKNIWLTQNPFSTFTIIKFDPEGKKES